MSTSSLIYIQQAITRYIFPIVLSLGNIGNFILLAVFLQQHYRKNPCSHYLLTAIVFGIISSNFAIVNNIYSVDHPNPTTYNLVFCRILGYVTHSCGMSYRTMIVLAAADQCAITSPQQAFRSFNSIKVSRRAIIITPVFWFTLSVHFLIWSDIQNGICFVHGLYGQIFSIYQIICAALLPLALLILFSLLTMRNIQRSRLRVTAQEEPVNLTAGALRPRDKNLLKLVFFDIIGYFICVFPYAINSVYAVY